MNKMPLMSYWWCMKHPTCKWWTFTSVPSASRSSHTSLHFVCPHSCICYINYTRPACCNSFHVFDYMSLSLNVGISRLTEIALNCRLQLSVNNVQGVQTTDARWKSGRLFTKTCFNNGIGEKKVSETTILQPFVSWTFWL